MPQVPGLKSLKHVARWELVDLDEIPTLAEAKGSIAD